MDCVISKLCYYEAVLQRYYRKMTIYGHFPITPLQNSTVKNLAVLYPNPYYNKVFVYLVGLWFNVPDNINGHVETVS